MKKTSTLLLVVTGIALVCLAVSLALRSRSGVSSQATPNHNPVVAPPAVVETAARPEATASVVEKPKAVVPAPEIVPVAAPVMVPTNSPAKAAPATVTRSKKPPIKDPVAREALSLVGVDPDAEAYWLDAINDSNLSAHERQDLIEDLNEEGFSDPKNLTRGDLPLIMNRIAIIEELAPDAMDKVNADAFAEAYKDLVNMYAKIAPR